MRANRIPKYFLIITLGLFAIPTIGQTNLELSGKVTDFKTEESIVGVAIKSFNSDNLINTKYSTEGGKFNLALTEELNKIEFQFIGYLPLIIDNITYSTDAKILDSKIQLYENPFGLVNYETKPTRNEVKERRREQKNIKRGLKVICDNGIEYKMKFSKKNYRYALYIDFQDLLRCNNKE